MTAKLKAAKTRLKIVKQALRPHLKPGERREEVGCIFYRSDDYDGGITVHRKLAKAASVAPFLMPRLGVEPQKRRKRERA